MFGVVRKQAQVSFMAEVGDILNLGDVVGMTMGGYGLSSGGLFRVLQSKEQLDLNGFQVSLIIGLQRLASD